MEKNSSEIMARLIIDRLIAVTKRREERLGYVVCECADCLDLRRAIQEAEDFRRSPCSN